MPAGADLGRWSLTVPVAGDGGHAENVRSARLYPPWLVRNRDGSLTFWAPVTGATTRGSRYPRTELRETMVPRQPDVNWACGDRAVLTATLRVEQVPRETGKVIVGQTHGYNVVQRSIGPLLMLSWVRGDLVATVRDTPTGDAQTRSTVARGLALGQPFSYRVDVRDGVVRVSVDGVERFEAPVTRAWDRVGLYFKAAAYVQATSTDPTDGGRVTVEALRVRH